MNRHYGKAPLGEPAYENQRYASKANFPINLLHLMQGIDYVNIIHGASNGFEMLFFFEEALNANRANGSVILERGDSVIMDNCGFHHGHFTEPVLREMLRECRVHVLFQPPYSPHSKTCFFGKSKLSWMPSRTSRKSNRIFYFFKCANTSHSRIPSIFSNIVDTFCNLNYSFIYQSI